ncbi:MULTISPECIES: alpha-ketoglutarate-dependent dioxygenase AlkB family protein [Pasteurellaceae]|uniref:alpha-ketoglutarate-dependent dioxygenase AlkB family protein n=1 Tax=Pasteurellaceae TaxID=712 RepID=UPI00356398A3
MNFDLFDFPPNPADNFLPFDGIVNDYDVIFAPDKADFLLHELLTHIPWRHDEAMIGGKRIQTARQVAWYGDADFSYTYSGVSHIALPWNALLLPLKQRVESELVQVSPTQFNSCLLNLYQSGNEGMAWHSDDERELGKNTVIASLSFGATRKFAFKHKLSLEKREMWLKHGQLIVMRGTTQSHWQHAVMKSSKISEPRVNLTFRTIVGKEKAA